ncbi:MAG: exo-alpha-sialidase [Bacteroidetes bacterium]|nr:exo-alpha-sialidase [Bacteroidota bacterium]
MNKRFLITARILALIIGTAGVPLLSIAQWSTPVNISPGAVSAILNESMGSCIGVSGDTVHVVYADRFTLKTGAVYYVQSGDTGLTWSNPVVISTLNGNAFNPAIAVNGSTVHVVWREIDTITQHRTSWYRHSLDGGNTWGTAVVLDTVVADWPAIAVSGNTVYVANDIVTSSSPYNTEIFFLRSPDNGATWGAHQQLTFSTGRSEDEAIAAQGPDVYMSWNDNRTGQMQIFYKHSGDYGVTWGDDVVVIPPFDYGTMVSVNGENVDIPCAGAASGHYQIHLVQSSNSGVTWATDMDLTQDPANTYYYPYMVRDGSDLHMTYVKSGVGAEYLHSGNGGSSWDPPFDMGYSNITPFIAFSRCVLHVIIPDSGRINYLRNPTGNAGPHCAPPAGISQPKSVENQVKVYPNPANRQTMIEISSSGKQEITLLEVFDPEGRIIISSSFGKNNKIILDGKKMVAGLYFYKVFQNEKVLGTGKIVVE